MTTMWNSVLDTTLCDEVCQRLAASWWFSRGAPVSSTNKTERHDMIEILLKVALNTTTHSPFKGNKFLIWYSYFLCVFTEVLMHNIFLHILSKEKVINNILKNIVRYVDYQKMCIILPLFIEMFVPSQDRKLSCVHVCVSWVTNCFRFLDFSIRL